MNRVEEIKFENSIRPKIFEHFIGQSEIKDSLSLYVEAANKRSRALDHVLFYGAPGLGKTTLANIIANELGTENFETTSGAVIQKPSDLNQTLMKMQDGGVLFIDEIHRLPKVVEEFLYPTLEDNALDLVIEEDGKKVTQRIELAKFTVIGATTRAGMISAPLRDRFGINYRLEVYNISELTFIVERTASILNTPITEDAAEKIAKCSRGTPRKANSWVKKCSDYALVRGNGTIDIEVVEKTLEMEGVDESGLDRMDRKILRTMVEVYKGRPVGLSSLAATVDENQETIETMYEPFLVQQGYVVLTPRGRMITDSGKKKIGE